MAKANLITSDHIKIIFVKFAVELTDRRNGKNSKAEAIEILDGSFNVAAAQKNVEKKYSELGYSVYDIEIVGQRTFTAVAAELYETLPDDELGKSVTGISQLPIYNDKWRQDAEAAAKEEFRGDI